MKLKVIMIAIKVCVKRPNKSVMAFNFKARSCMLNNNIFQQQTANKVNFSNINCCVD